MKEVHLIVQGKGGVGKSLAAAMLAQYLKTAANEEIPVYCFDTDPSGFKFEVQLSTTEKGQYAVAYGLSCKKDCI